MRCSIDGLPSLIVAGLAVVVSTAACGSSTPRPPSPFTDSPSAADEPYSPNEISHSEIRSRGSNDHTAMALVRRLRPGWLLARGQKSFTDEGAQYPVVYIDEIRHGSLSTLHQIPSTEIMSMQFFNQADATTRWGTGHPSGVINVVTGR